MQTLASLSRVTKHGHNSVWHFVQTPEGYFAFGGCTKPNIKRLDTLDQLRAMYRNYVKYGYTPVLANATQLALPV